jgi:hypothetical protein
MRREKIAWPQPLPGDGILARAWLIVVCAGVVIVFIGAALIDRVTGKD